MDPADNVMVSRDRDVLVYRVLLVSKTSESTYNTSVQTIRPAHIAKDILGEIVVYLAIGIATVVSFVTYHSR